MSGSNSGLPQILERGSENCSGFEPVEMGAEVPKSYRKAYNENRSHLVLFSFFESFSLGLVIKSPQRQIMNQYFPSNTHGRNTHNHNLALGPKSGFLLSI